MVDSRQAGFSLIEIIVVFAITSMLAVTALAGQQALRSRLQFDASVNQMVASVNDARNEATAGVNNTADAQAGQGTLKCAGGPDANNSVFPFTQYVFAGVMWQVQSADPNVSLHYYKALSGTIGPSGVSCEFRTKNVPLPRGISLASPAGGVSKTMFVRDGTGILRTCFIASANPLPYFSGNTICSATTPNILTVTDAAGHQARLQIDASGLAKRL